METIKVSCLLCKQQFIVAVDPICWPCSSQSFLLKLDKEVKESRSYKFWKGAKDFALFNVFYLPIAMLINFKFGLEAELWWVGGSIFIQMFLPFHRWLLSKI
jgi:hypothetical protein